MKLKQLFVDDSAVSPVIGVILMVAITVILAAVIGSFVLNLGGSLQESAPQASIGMESSNLGDSTTGNDGLTIVHQSGDTVTAAAVSVNIGDTNIYNQGSGTDANTNGWSGDGISAGDTLSFDENGGGSTTVSGEQTVRVVYNSPDSDSSATLASQTFIFD